VQEPDISARGTYFFLHIYVIYHMSNAEIILYVKVIIWCIENREMYRTEIVNKKFFQSINLITVFFRTVTTIFSIVHATSKQISNGRWHASCKFFWPSIA
jgi:hypothetical protein